MSSIDELITELCPRGVRYLQLGSVCRVRTGQSVSKLSIDQDPGPYPVINSGKEPLGYISSFNTEDDPLGITSRGAGVGSVTWCEGKYFRGNLNYSATILDSKQLNKRFLFHALTFLQSSIQQLCTYQGIPALNKANLEKLSVPVPPLEVQREIVRILDTFSKMESELEAELEARKQQYEYYRNSLLNSDGGASMQKRPLGDVCAFQNGFAFKSSLFRPEGSPILRISNIQGDGINSKKLAYFDPNDYKEDLTKFKVTFGDIVIAMSGATTGKVGRYSGREILHLNQRVGKFVPDEKQLLMKYLYYILTSRTTEIYELAGGGAQPNLSTVSINRMNVQIPSVVEQKRIVDILDKFDALVNDLSVGLPAELTARRQQYEYYRDKLLTFKELEPAS